MNYKEKIYTFVRKIPKGKVTTYKELAHSVGFRAYRAVGQILKRNEDGFMDKGKTPCHRVVSSNGNIGGFYGQKSGSAIDVKRKLLEKEGIKFDKKDFVVDFEKKLYKFRR